MRNIYNNGMQQVPSFTELLSCMHHHLQTIMLLIFSSKCIQLNFFLKPHQTYEYVTLPGKIPCIMYQVLLP